MNVDIFLHLAHKYPDMARRRVRKLGVPELTATFDAWFERCGKKIPAKFRADIRASADTLIAELEQLTT